MGYDPVLHRQSSSPRIGFSRKAFLAQGISRFGEELFFYEHPHNLYLQIFSLLGIAGFIIFIWLCVDIGKKIYRLSKSPDSANALMGKAMSASFLVLLFENLVEGSLNSCRMMMSLFLVIAILDHLCSGESSAIETERQEKL